MASAQTTLANSSTGTLTTMDVVRNVVADANIDQTNKDAILGKFKGKYLDICIGSTDETPIATCIPSDLGPARSVVGWSNTAVALLASTPLEGLQDLLHCMLRNREAPKDNLLHINPKDTDPFAPRSLAQKILLVSTLHKVVFTEGVKDALEQNILQSFDKTEMDLNIVKAVRKLPRESPVIAKLVQTLVIQEKKIPPQTYNAIAEYAKTQQPLYNLIHAVWAEYWHSGKFPAAPRRLRYEGNPRLFAEGQQKALSRFQYEQRQAVNRLREAVRKEIKKVERKYEAAAVKASAKEEKKLYELAKAIHDKVTTGGGVVSQEDYALYKRFF